MKLLMIEDNKSVVEMMAIFFKKEQWEVTYVYDGITAVEEFNKDPQGWDIITLDLNLPGKDGMEVAAEIRKVSQTVPLIIITARDTDSDQVLGLEMGADDYVVKPFSPITLIARIKALTAGLNYRELAREEAAVRRQVLPLMLLPPTSSSTAKRGKPT